MAARVERCEALLAKLEAAWRRIRAEEPPQLERVAKFQVALGLVTDSLEVLQEDPEAQVRASFADRVDACVERADALARAAQRPTRSRSPTPVAGDEAGGGERAPRSRRMSSKAFSSAEVRQGSLSSVLSLGDDDVVDLAVAEHGFVPRSRTFSLTSFPVVDETLSPPRSPARGTYVASPSDPPQPPAPSPVDLSLTGRNAFFPTPLRSRDVQLPDLEEFVTVDVRAVAQTGTGLQELLQQSQLHVSEFHDPNKSGGVLANVVWESEPFALELLGGALGCSALLQLPKQRYQRLRLEIYCAARQTAPSTWYVFHAESAKATLLPLEAAPMVDAAEVGAARDDGVYCLFDLPATVFGFMAVLGVSARAKKIQVHRLHLLELAGDEQDASMTGSLRSVHEVISEGEEDGDAREEEDELAEEDEDEQKARSDEEEEEDNDDDDVSGFVTPNSSRARPLKRPPRVSTDRTNEGSRSRQMSHLDVDLPSDGKPAGTPRYVFSDDPEEEIHSARPQMLGSSGASAQNLHMNGGGHDEDGDDDEAKAQEVLSDPEQRPTERASTSPSNSHQHRPISNYKVKMDLPIRSEQYGDLLESLLLDPEYYVLRLVELPPAYIRMPMLPEPKMTKRAKKKRRKRLHDLVVVVFLERYVIPFIHPLLRFEVENCVRLSDLLQPMQPLSQLVRAALLEYGASHAENLCGLIGASMETSVAGLESDMGFEIDPLSIWSYHPSNVDRLEFTCALCVDAVTSSLSMIPSYVRQLIVFLSTHVARAFPERPNAKMRALAHYFFTEYVCAALRNEAAKEAKMEREVFARGLELVATVVEQLSRLALFHDQDSYLAEMNPFIEKNLRKMMAFYDELGSFSGHMWTSCPAGSMGSDENKHDLEERLHRLNEHFTYRKQLPPQLKRQRSIRSRRNKLWLKCLSCCSCGT